MAIISLDDNLAVKNGGNAGVFPIACEIQLGGEASMAVTDSFSALCEIEFDGAARYDGEPIVCEIELGASAQVSIDGSPDVFLTAECEITFGAQAAIGVTDYFYARCLIEFDAVAGVNVSEADTYRLNVIVDVVQGGWDDPNTP